MVDLGYLSYKNLLRQDDKNDNSSNMSFSTILLDRNYGLHQNNKLSFIAFFPIYRLSPINREEKKTKNQLSSIFAKYLPFLKIFQDSRMSFAHSNLKNGKFFGKN